MDPGGSPPEISVEDVLPVFSGTDRPSTPLTAAEVADELDRSPGAVRDALEELADEGVLFTREIAGAARVWWPADDREPGGSATTERTEAEQLGTFIDAVTDYAIFMLDPDGHVVSWNDGAERIKGYAEEDVVGEHLSTFYTDADDADGVPGANLDAAAAEGRVEDRGWRVREDGSQFWADVVITAIRDEDGTLQGFTKVTRDLTERREYEQELRRERDLIERIFETVPVSVTVLAPDGEFRRANSRAVERLGIDGDGIDRYTANSWALYDADGRPIPDEATPWAEAARTGDPVYDVECQVELPDIGRRWLSINAAPIEEEEAADDRIVLSVDDITGLKERERDLRRERNQTEELLRTAPVAIVVQGAAGDTLLANRRAQEHLGLTEREIVDEPDDADEWRLYDADGDDLDPGDSPSVRARRSGEPVFEEEIGIEDPDGERTWFSISATPVFDPDGELDRVVTAAEDITPIKRRERQLERRKTELETELGEVLDRISDAFYALDEDWRFTHVNDRAEGLLQRPREDLVGASIWEEFPEATGTTIRDRFQEAMDAQEPASFEFRYDELGTWLEVNAYPSETGLSVYFRDITDRKEREDELERYRTIVETVNDGIYTVDRDGQFSMVNETYAEMTGYPREELVGSHVSLVVDDAVTESARELERDLVAGEHDEITIEAEIQRADGDTLPAEAAFSLLPSDDDYERVGIVRDISERKAQERALEESERRYRTLAENFPNGAVGLFDEDLRYTAIGGELVDTAGVDPEDRIGNSVYDIYPDELVEAVEPYFRAAIDGDAHSFEAEFHDRDLLAHTLPIRNADDEIYAGMLVVQDITERVEYRRQLEETIEKLEASNERLEQFAYIASHDLQEPLRMVTSYLELLETRYREELDEEAEEFIAFAVEGAGRMREMIHDLLAYSRLDSEAEPLEPTDAERVVDRVIDRLQLQLAENDAEVIVGDLPTVVADRNQLEQLFQNLVSNAIKYRDDDPPRIEIDAQERADEWEFSVADNGIGIDPERTDQIFEIFKRLHSRDEYPGTGIGLALCQKIVRRHGGEIRVDSEPGEGSTFTFAIPRSDGDEE